MSQAPVRTRAREAFAPALLLLTICVLISYTDRGILSIAAPLLKDELSLSASQLGLLLAAFFWSYTAMQFVSGWLVDRFNVNFFIAAGYCLWSLSTAATGIVHGFALLFTMRLLLGTGESVAFPSCSKILARNLPDHRRGFANGLLMAGIRLGPAVGTFVAGPLISKHGWRPIFLGIGLLSLLWLPAWFRWMPGGSAQPVDHHGESPTAAAIFAQRSFWGASIGHFSVNYIFYFMLTWLPFYLVRERGLTMTEMVSSAGVYYLTDATSAALTGWVSDFWMRHGASATLARKSAMAAGYAIAIVAIAGCALSGPQHYYPWLLATGVGVGMMGAGVFSFSQTLGGPHGAGKWTGLQNGFGNFAGILGPAVTGFVVDKTGNFLAPFAITEVVLAVGILGWVFMIKNVEPIIWSVNGPVNRLVSAAQENTSPDLTL